MLLQLKSIIVGYCCLNEHRRYNDRSYNNNTSYTDSNFITNTCFTDEKLEISKSITCNSNTFYDNIRDTKYVLDTNLIYVNNQNACTQIIYYDFSYDTPIGTSVNTVAYTAVVNCKFINYNATEYRIDICDEDVINVELNSHTCHSNGIGNVRNLFLFHLIRIADESVIDFLPDWSDFCCLQ